MKHLQSFSLFESEANVSLNDWVWTTLKGRVTFPELLERDEPAWAAIVCYVDWDEYSEQEANRDDYNIMPQEEYDSYVSAYQPTDAQIAFDDFIAGILGYTELQAEITEENPPVEWYMTHFEQPRDIASMMKSVADENLGALELNPEWEG